MNYIEISAAYKNGLCWNCCYDKTDTDINKTIETITKVRNDGWNFSNTFTTIEYLVTCLDCDEHNPIGYYSYLSVATHDGREHVLSSSHKLVTISEIVCDNHKALESIRIDIKFL